MSCNCTTPCTSTCPSYCGCTVQVPGTCVFYQGSNLTCIDATKGDTYDSILANINDIVCDLLPPSGLPDYVGAGGEIVITGNVIGLDPAITGAISTAQTNIAGLQACNFTTVKNITSASPNLLIFTTSTNECGRSLSINFVPSVVPDSEKQGIIDNKTGSVTILNNHFISYDLSPYALSTGDVIKFKGNLRRLPNAATVKQTYLITDGISTNTMTSNGGANGINMFTSLDDFEIILSVVSNLAGTLTVKTYGVFNTLFINPTVGGNEEFFENTKGNLGKVFQFASSIALDETNVRLVFQNLGVTPVMEQYFVEIIRKI